MGPREPSKGLKGKAKAVARGLSGDPIWSRWASPSKTSAGRVRRPPKSG